MSDLTRLKDVEEIGNSLLSDQLETNISTWLNWGLLGIGGFFNVNIPASGAYGGQKHRLRMADDVNYGSGQIWEGFRKDWVWETGIERAQQPIKVSGVYVNGGFHSISETGTYSHHINYPLGQVIFNNPIPASSIVTCEYSYRLYQVVTADCPWWREIQENSFRVDDSQFLQTGSGDWSMMSQNRIQLPAIIVEAVPNVSYIKPFGIGESTQIVGQPVNLYILGETAWDRKQMHDILIKQKEKRITGFDKNLMFSNNAFPLDEYGSLASGAKMYPDYIKPTGQGGFGWRQIRIANTQSSPMPSNPPSSSFFNCLVRFTCEIDL